VTVITGCSKQGWAWLRKLLSSSLAPKSFEVTENIHHIALKPTLGSSGQLHATPDAQQVKTGSASTRKLQEPACTAGANLFEQEANLHEHEPLQQRPWGCRVHERLLEPCHRMCLCLQNQELGTPNDNRKLVMPHSLQRCTSTIAPRSNSSAATKLIKPNLSTGDTQTIRLSPGWQCQGQQQRQAAGQLYNRCTVQLYNIKQSQQQGTRLVGASKALLQQQQ
jgi:hypothetical protein